MLIYRANLPTSQTLLIDVTASQIDLVIVQLGLSLTTTFSARSEVHSTRGWLVAALE